MTSVTDKTQESLSNWLNLPEDARKLKVIEVYGTPYQRGFQHGQILKKEISEIIVKWKNCIGIKAPDPDSLLSEFLLFNDFESAINKYTPGLLDEVKGIADGSGQSFNDIYAFQLMDELDLYMENKNNHCSGLGVASQGRNPVYIAENMDMETFYDGYQTVLHIKGDEDTPEQYVLTTAGMIALNGMNKNRVAVCVNALLQLKTCNNGLPVAFIIRGILNMSSEDQILDFIQKTPHASGQNYIIGIGDKVYDFETSAFKVARFIPYAGADMVYHTNHPIVNEDFEPAYEMRVTDSEGLEDNSHIRFANMENDLIALNGLISDDDIKKILSSKDDADNPICRPIKIEPDELFTFASVIMTLSDTPTIQVSMGPPDENEYAMFDFENSKNWKQQPSSKQNQITNAS